MLHQHPGAGQAGPECHRDGAGHVGLDAAGALPGREPTGANRHRMLAGREPDGEKTPLDVRAYQRRRRRHPVATGADPTRVSFADADDRIVHGAPVVAENRAGNRSAGRRELDAHLLVRAALQEEEVQLGRRVAGCARTDQRRLGTGAQSEAPVRSGVGDVLDG